MAKTTKTKTKKTKVIAEQDNSIVDLDAETTQDISPKEITLAKFKKLFKEEIDEAADWLWREDKEGDFEDKKTIKAAAISFVRDQHPEYTVID